MKRKRMLVILGHPSNDSFCGAVSERYVEAATQAGHEVRLLRLDTLDFDPVLHDGYNQIQLLEPDLINAQNDITWAEHLTLVPDLVGRHSGVAQGVLRPRVSARLCLQVPHGLALPG